MDTTKFTMGIVGLVVIILMVTGAVLPAVNDAQNQQITEVNNTTMKYISSDNLDFVLSFDNDNKAPLINGQVAPGIDPANPTNTVFVVTDKFLARSSIYNGHYTAWAITSSEIIGTSYTAGNAQVTSVAGAVSIVDTSTDTEVLTTTITTALVPSESGKYGMFLPSSSLKLYADKDALIYYINQASADFFLAKTNPTDKNPLSADIVYAMVDGSIVTTGTKTVSGSQVEDDYGNDYYEITATAGGAFPAVFAPVTYHVITSDDSMLRSLIGIIPLLLIIVAVLYAVRLMGASRN